jgi:hypothetical protein
MELRESAEPRPIDKSGRMPDGMTQYLDRCFGQA